MLGFLGHTHIQSWRLRQPAAAVAVCPTPKAAELESGMKRFDDRYINTGSGRAGGESL